MSVAIATANVAIKSRPMVVLYHGFGLFPFGLSAPFPVKKCIACGGSNNQPYRPGEEPRSAHA